MFNFQRAILITLLLFYWAADAAKSLNSSKNDTDPSSQLIFANVIFRHGDRHPIASYPTSLYKNESNWLPRGFGQLTNLGIAQEFELGEFFRRRYKSLLDGGKYPYDIAYIQSTDFDRTLSSASACSAGLFPPQGDEIWSENLTWQPVPIYSTPRDLDYVFFAGEKCPRYDRAMRRYFDSPEYSTLIAKYTQLFQYLEEMSGAQIRTFDDAQSLYNTLWIEQLKYKTLPEWAMNDDIFGEGSDFEWCANYDFKISTDSPELARLSTGFLIREMLENFTQKIKSNIHRSLNLYSAHDATIANVLNSLGLFDLHNPPYSASIHFELYKTKGDHYVQLFYRNSSNENPLPLDIPECGTKCPLQEFIRIYSDIIPTGGFDEECQLPLYLRILEDKYVSIPREYFIALMLLALVLPIVAIISCKHFYRARGNIIIDNNNMKYL